MYLIACFFSSYQVTYLLLVCLYSFTPLDGANNIWEQAEIQLDLSTALLETVSHVRTSSKQCQILLICFIVCTLGRAE